MSDEHKNNILSSTYVEEVKVFRENFGEALRQMFSFYDARPGDAVRAIARADLSMMTEAAAGIGHMIEGLAHLAREAGGIAALAALSPVVPSEEMNRTIEQAAFGFLRRDEPQMVDAPDLLM